MGLSGIRSRIAESCKKAGRDPGDVTLVVVGKTQPADRLAALMEQGQLVFGENRVQEAAEKFPALRENYPGIELHFIGHLQTNKAKDAVRLFDVIETVDSKKLAEELATEMQKQKRRLPCFIQVNTGNEEQKGGVDPKELPDFFRFCTVELNLPVEGLMCIPPVDEIPDLHFALLRHLAQDLGLKKLSMGMSADFETAIRYGATYVRIGSAIFDIKEN